MTLLTHALRTDRAKANTAHAKPRTALVAGGGGALGSAVLEALLGGRRFAHVKVLATRALGTAMQGLEPVVVNDFGAAPALAGAPIADTAVIVFDRERHANGRELAFLRPAPDEIATLAAWLRRHGVRALLVVMPHAPAALPEALKAGLANLDEHAVAAMDFEQLVFVRSAQAPSNARATPWLQRLADGLLAQLRIMVASTNQPVRASKVAQFVAELAVQLDRHPPGTRVAPPELVWQAAQLRDPAPLVQAWLGARALPEVSAPPRRW